MKELTPTNHPPSEDNQLKEWFTGLRRQILALEDALSQGHLIVTLNELDNSLHEEFKSVYGRLSEGQASPKVQSPLRIKAVASLLNQIQQNIFEARVTAEAKALSWTHSNKDVAQLRARITDGDWVELRADQMLAARFWGIHFEFAEPRARAAMERRIFQTLVHSLSTDLRSLHKVLEYFRPGTSPENVVIVPTVKQQRLEHLILDILNEDMARARLAPLLEDFLEKTDLRVHYPELERKSGARVQVTQVTDANRHKNKLLAMRNVEEFVIVSPISLSAFHGVLRAGEIKRTLLFAIAHAPLSPLGPLAHVPESLRALVRKFVHEGARRSTSLMRDRRKKLEESRRLQPSTPKSKKNLERAAAARQRETLRTQRQKTEQEHLRRRQTRIHQLSVGDQLCGTVENIVEYGVFIELDGVSGLLHQTKTPSTMWKQALELGSAIEVVILHLDASQGRVSLGLSETKKLTTQ